MVQYLQQLEHRIIARLEVYVLSAWNTKAEIDSEMNQAEVPDEC